MPAVQKHGGLFSGLARLTGSIHFHDAAQDLIVKGLGVGDGYLDCAEQVPVVDHMAAKTRAEGDDGRAVGRTVIDELSEISGHITDQIAKEGGIVMWREVVADRQVGIIGAACARFLDFSGIGGGKARSASNNQPLPPEGGFSRVMLGREAGSFCGSVVILPVFWVGARILFIAESVLEQNADSGHSGLECFFLADDVSGRRSRATHPSQTGQNTRQSFHL
jgi:hypothetical protein